MTEEENCPVGGRECADSPGGQGPAVAARTVLPPCPPMAPGRRSEAIEVCGSLPPKPFERRQCAERGGLIETAGNELRERLAALDDRLALSPDMAVHLRLASEIVGGVERRAMMVLAAYNLLKFILAYGILEKLSVNPWGFLFWDLATIPPYVLGMGQLVRHLTGQSGSVLKISVWGVILMAAFLAPYLYLALCGGGGFPPVVTWVLSSMVLLMLVNLVRTVRLHIREKKGRRKPGEAASR